MSFNINVWRVYYDQTRSIGAIVRKNVHDFHTKGSCELSRDEIDMLIDQASAIAVKCGAYMDKYNIKATVPKWIYNAKDCTTHASHPDFAYSHLL